MERMRELIDKIKELNYHYYTLDEPLVSDSEYDALYYELKDLEESEGFILDDSPTQIVGDRVLDKFVKHTHLGRLYSLDKAQTYEEIEAWMQRANKLRDEYNNFNSEKLPEIEYIVELKFDGLTINLTYNEGKLINAATRGTGVIGEEILSQVKTIKTIPNTIDYKGLIEVSGEGVMPLSELKKYNELHEDKLKNARNAAAGALRNLDPKVTKSRNLECYLYNVTYMQEEMIDSQLGVFAFLRENGFKIYPFLKKVTNFQELIQVIEKIGKLTVFFPRLIHGEPYIT